MVVVFPLVALQVICIPTLPHPGAGSEQPQRLLALQLLFCAENPQLGHLLPALGAAVHGRAPGAGITEDLEIGCARGKLPAAALGTTHVLMLLIVRKKPQYIFKTPLKVETVKLQQWCA